MSNEIKDLSGAAALLSQLKELLSLLMSIPDVSSTGTNPGKPLGDSVPATKDLSALEESSVTSKMDGDKKLYLLHHATTGDEYEKSVDDAESAEESSNEYKTSIDTEWSVTNNGGDDLAVGKKPVVSCWIPESSIKEMKNAIENTGTWGELGENPFIEEFRVVVKPGTYTIYAELKKSWSGHMHGLLRKSGFLSTTSSRHPAMKTNNATGMIPHPKTPKDIPHVRADSQTEINFKIEKSNELEKDLSQIKFKNLGMDTRPEQDVRIMNTGSPESVQVSKKLLTGYKRNKKNPIDAMVADPERGLHDPYKSGIALATTQTRPAIVAHEGHHRLAWKLSNKYGVEAASNLYSKMINLMPQHVTSVIHSTLQQDPDYKRLYESGLLGNRQHKYAYQQEIINYLRDLSTGGRAREALRVELPRGSDFKKFDNDLKSSWKNIVDFAKKTKYGDLS